ncbi:ABC transporter permease [Metamycoplasma phocicerebrale]|uniref:ABC transporter permease n=1 Tax=Metamycoplasma phocicerebrale TaxID=142649 RepID=A0A3Q9V9Z3_9BACT|nr:ABC transporter permease [Metamycoplasma phocicerebrale]AZZ65322.1 ABC transporter permease [Metamycoplasma phocicerebrale]
MNEILYDTSSSATSTQKASGSFLLFSAIVTLLMIVNMYLLIKYFINYKRTIDKTQKVLSEYLVKDYIQGLSFKSNAFFNIIIIVLIIFSQVFISLFALVRVYNSGNVSYAPVFIAAYEIGLIMLGAFVISHFVLRYVKFNYPQYKNTNEDVYNELVSLKELKKEALDKNYPKKISIDLKKLRSSNVLLPNVFSKWIGFYNDMSEIEFKKQYPLFLSQLFKIKYFAEVNESIEKGKSLNIESEKNKLTVEPANLTKIEKEVLWMEQADRKAKILKETEDLSKMSKEEFNKKYEEYVYSARTIDPLYQPVSKNSWLFYRDAEIEDLFYNTNVSITYTMDEGKKINEDMLPDFLIKYQDYLISKFLLNIE